MEEDNTEDAGVNSTSGVSGSKKIVSLFDSNKEDHEESTSEGKYISTTVEELIDFIRDKFDDLETDQIKSRGMAMCLLTETGDGFVDSIFFAERRSISSAMLIGSIEEMKSTILLSGVIDGRS